jgi:hypothetical protein
MALRPHAISKRETTRRSWGDAVAGIDESDRGAPRLPETLDRLGSGLSRFQTRDCRQAVALVNLDRRLGEEGVGKEMSL